MDILLFNPYYTQLKKFYSFYSPAPPISLMYLAGYLKKHGLSSKIYELGIFEIEKAKQFNNSIRFGLSDAEIVTILEKEKPRIVGITSMYSIFYRDALEIAKLIKKVSPEIKVVLGGNHASSYWKHVLKNQAVDFVVIGEGEETFLELVRTLTASKPFEHILGLGWRDNSGRIKRSPERPLIKNLDEIPFPEVDLINYHRYFSHTNPFAMRAPVISLITSRGCPGKCVYCTVKAVWGRSWRGRSPKNVVDEIENYMRKYNIREFAFLDDSASVDRKRWEGLCDEIIARSLNIKWTTPNGIAHWTLTKDILDKMKKAGCYRITFGIESGYPETRRFLGKPYSLQQAKELIQHANRIGLWTICTNIIGFPYENLNSINATIDFAKRCGTDFAAFYLLMPQPTSEVYEYFKKEGLLNFDSFFEKEDFNEEQFEKINYILNETGSDTVHFKKEELNRLQKQAYRAFLLHRGLSYLANPLKILRKIHSMEDLRFILRIIRKGIQIFLRTLNPFNKKTSDYLYVASKQDIGNEPS
ncbi:MAG: radical SAM protein [Candidatus Omnitrophota bacterium]